MRSFPRKSGISRSPIKPKTPGVGKDESCACLTYDAKGARRHFIVTSFNPHLSLCLEENMVRATILSIWNISIERIHNID
jgi:hypothetical protein